MQTLISARVERRYLAATPTVNPLPYKSNPTFESPTRSFSPMFFFTFVLSPNI